MGRESQSLVADTLKVLPPSGSRLYLGQTRFKALYRPLRVCKSVLHLRRLWRKNMQPLLSAGKRVNLTMCRLAKRHHCLAVLLPPHGFRPEGEIPRRHSSNSRILRKVLTVEIYSQYARKNLDLPEEGPQGIGR